jgi:hypothetical protein
MANDRRRCPRAARRSGAGCGCSTTRTRCPTSAASTAWPSSWCARRAPASSPGSSEGARQFYADGLRTPASVKAATAGYADDEDDLGRFITERLIVGPPTEVATPTNVVTVAYHRWCADEGCEPVNAKRFGMELRARCGAQVHRTNGRRFYLGITLAAGEHESIFTPLPTNPAF